MRALAWIFVLVSTSLWGARERVAVQQEPQGRPPGERAADRPPAPPPDAAQLPPVPVPYVEPVLRQDLPERFAQRDAIEGQWQLRDRMVDGVPAEVGTGQLAVGRRHLMVQVQVPTENPEIPLLRAGTYAWTRTGEADLVRMTVVIGHYNDVDGGIHLEPVGTTELRRFQLLDGRLRIYQDIGNWLEFARVE